MPMGSITKLVVVHAEPFWRRDGVSGEGIGLTGPVPAAFDVPHPDGPGHLCVLVAGRAAQRLAELAPPRRRAAVLRELARWFGPAAAEPTEWWEKSWPDEPHVRGGYSAYSPPGVLTSAGPALRTPVGRIHWAGTGTATAWVGHIDGAVESGDRAAAEVTGARRPVTRAAGRRA
jgi:monoamine oxidase